MGWCKVVMGKRQEVTLSKFAEAKDNKHGTIRPKTPHRLSTTTLGLDNKLILKEPSNE